jgi:hypothetical protein
VIYHAIHHTFTEIATGHRCKANYQDQRKEHSSPAYPFKIALFQHCPGTGFDTVGCYTYFPLKLFKAIVRMPALPFRIIILQFFATLATKGEELRPEFIILPTTFTFQVYHRIEGFRITSSYQNRYKMQYYKKT